MATNALKSQGIVVAYETTPGTYAPIGEVVTIEGPGGEATIIDATHLQSTAKEKLIGLPDEGRVTLGVNLVPGDAGQTQMRADRLAATRRNYKITLTDTATTELTFAAYCMGFSISAGIDDKVSANIQLEVTGAVTYA
jgi:Lambda phage tail tube protein, TTP